MIKIIPTPQYVQMSEASVRICDTEQNVFYEFDGKKTEIIETGLSFLSRKKGIHLKEIQPPGVPRIILSYTIDPTRFILCADDLAVFDSDTGASQGYIIKQDREGPLIIVAKEDMGLLYGLVTLVQMMENCLVPEKIHIRDHPDFMFRGSAWTVFCDIGVLSYDWGDGLDQYIERFKNKLDMALFFKTNAIYTDGFGWDVNRSPEYASFNRTLCKEARKRGIQLIYGGYSSGYGISDSYHYRGKVFLNRKSYPDGEIYPCSGIIFNNKPQMGRTYGTCLSNTELNKLKIKEISEFVRCIQPGGMLLHNLDASDFDTTLWQSRCDDCRKKWPNDDIYARDGMAGAYAEFFNALRRSVNQVKEEGYEAAKDCALLFTSPGYLDAKQNDENYLISLRFWQNVDKYMDKDDGSYILNREVFFNQKENTTRMSQIVKSREHTKTVVGFFSGGDQFMSNKLYQMTASFVYLFEGATYIICFNGNAYQEPLFVANAEYMWNSRNSAFFNWGSDAPANDEEFWPVYDLCRETVWKPQNIYGENGLLDISCQKLYGDAAGRKMADLYRLHGQSFETPILFAANKEIGMNLFKLTGDFEIRWDKPLQKDRLKKICESYREHKRITREGLKIVSSIIEHGHYKPEIEQDFRWYLSSLIYGDQLMVFLYRYISLYVILDTCFSSGGSFEEAFNQCEKLIENIVDYLEEDRSLGLTPIDVNGGAMVRRYEALKFLIDNLKIMKMSVLSGERIPKHDVVFPEHTWW